MDLKSIAEAYQSIKEKKLDPVGKEDGDVNNDGKKDSTDSYLMNRRKAIAKAMKKEAYTVTNADKKGNTPAYQGYKAGKKNVKTGEPLYKAAPHMKEHHQKDKDGNTIPHEDEIRKEEVEQIDELSKKTLSNYIKKGTKDIAKRASDDESHSGPKYGKKMSRMDGVMRAADKLAKEETVLEQLTENGREIDAFEAVISYLIDEGFAKDWDEAQNIMVTLKPELIEEVYQNQLVESEKLAKAAYERAQKLGAKRRRSSDPSGIYKSERAGYNLAQSQRSRNVSPATQGGNQTGGGPKDFGFARHKKNPVKSKSVGDTGGIGHQKKADTKITMKKDGKTPLKTPRYKYSTKQRDQMGFYGRMQKRDPKNNPKHEANKKK